MIRSVVITLVLALCMSVTAAAQDDGVSKYSRDFSYAMLTDAANMAVIKQNTEPFIVSFFALRALKLMELPFDQVGGAHLELCRSAIAYYDKELDPVLQPLTTRPKTLTQKVDATDKERAAVQKFVTQKYGAKYILRTENGRALPPDPVATWKYALGAQMGVISARISQWSLLPDNALFDAIVAKEIGGLSRVIASAPNDTQRGLIDALGVIWSYRNKTRFTPQDRHAIATAFRSALNVTLAFTKPAGKNP